MDRAKSDHNLGLDDYVKSLGEYEHKKYCAAKYVWPLRNQKTPRSNIKWSAWFKNMFGEELINYRERIKHEYHRNKHCFKTLVES